MQREAENRAGDTPGGLTRDDLGRLNRAEWDRDRQAADERAGREGGGWLQPPAAEARPAESIMDEVDPDNTSAMRAQGLTPDEPLQLTGGMLDALKKPENMIRLAGMGLGLIGLLLLIWGLRVEAQQLAPGSALASPTPTAAATGSPLTQASPAVNGTGTANASFTKVSGPCSLAARFNDRYSFMATNGALTLTQLSNNHVSRGTISPSGDFTTMAEGQGYRGTVTGTTARGQHTYTAQGCNEVYDFTMTFPTAFIGGGGAQQANRPPEAGAIRATQTGTTTTYTVLSVSDPDGDQLRYQWTSTNPCGPPTGHATPTLVWPHPHPPCPEEGFHPATITVRIDDGRFAITRTYSGGSAQGTGPVPAAGAGISTIAPSPTATPTATATAAAATATTTAGAVVAGTSGVNIPLILIALIFLIGALGLWFGGPRLVGGPAGDDPTDAADPCEREKARVAAAQGAADAADARMRELDSLAENVQSTQRDAAAKDQAVTAATAGASSYVNDAKQTVYTNPQQRARIEAAQADAAAAHAAADAAQTAYSAAGGAAARQAAADNVFKAHRELRDAQAALDACLRIVRLATPAPAPRPTSGGGGTAVGGTGVGLGTGYGDGTRTRTPGCSPIGHKRNETSSEHRFSMNDVGNAQISSDSLRLNSDDSHARRFLQHLGRVDDAFGHGKAAAGVAGGEVVGPLLDELEFPDFLTYFGEIREKLDETMERFFEQLRQNRRQTTWTISYAIHHFRLSCEKWEECDGEQYVPKSKITLTLLRTAPASLGPEVLTDEHSRRVWLDNWISRLRGSNDNAQRDADDFRQRCRQ